MIRSLIPRWLWLLTALTASQVTPAAALSGEPAAAPEQRISHAYLVTNADSDYPTEIHIINLSDEMLHVAGTLYSNVGTQLGDANILLAAAPLDSGARLRLTATDLETLFGVSTWTGPALLKIEGSADFEVMSQLSNPDGQLSNTNCTTTNSVHGLANNGIHHTSFLRLINQGSKPITNIAGTLTDENGQVIGQSSQLLASELAGHGASWLSADQLAAIFGGWVGSASLAVTADNEADLRLLLLNRQNGEYANFTCNQRGAKAVRLTGCDEPRPEFCKAIYDPVCAARDNGIRCVTTPCDSIEWATYSSGCSACADPLVFRHRAGSCETIIEGGL